MRPNAMPHDEVIRLAREAHQKHWRMSGDEGTGDKLAAAVTSDWRSAVLALFPGRFAAEQAVGKLRERMDLVDLVGGVAYELKVSPNNDHFESYRDIFKVMVARDNGLPQINHSALSVQSRPRSAMKMAFARQC